MKSINKFIVVMLCFVLFTIMAFALSACTEKELEITKIEVSGPSEIAVGEFDYNDYTVKLIFDDGSTENIKLNEDLISASDRELLDTPGTHTITVKYNDVTCTFTVTIKSQDKGIKSIAISGPNEIVAGHNDYSDFDLVITYEDDSTTTIELREEFILEEDRAKLNTVGSHSISIIYNGITTTWNIAVKENESTGDNIFEGVTFEDATYTYDGREKSIEVNGVPNGATVKYNVSNSYTNAGVYPVEAKISKEGYKTLVLTATLTINKATYDMSGVEFVDKTVVYNGEVQRIEISGSLPQGVTVTYENNDKTDVGIYEVIAKFTGDSNNYEAIADMTASLTIEEVKGTEGLIYEKINEDTEYSVVGYEGSESDVVIQSMHENLPVTSIGERAFDGCSGLTSITIPDSVISIGNWAFAYCSGLTSITIPDSVTSIGLGALNGCSGLKSITIPFVGRVSNGVANFHFGAIFGALNYSNNSSYVPKSLKEVIITGGASIGSYAFNDCTDLTSITIPDSVRRIENCAFYNCSKLISIMIPDGVTSIGDSAFEDCRGLTSITIPDSVTSIGDRVFYGCTGLTSLTIGNSVTSIGDYAFSYCSELTSINVVEKNSKYYSKNNCLIETASKTLIAGCKTSVIPDDESVTSIGQYAFLGCSGLTSIIISDSVKSIGSTAFFGCIGLASVTIGSGVTNIGDSAFGSCIGLTSITIPDSVTSIGEWVFAGCNGLTIYCEVNSKPSGWNTYWKYFDCPVVWDCNNNEIAEDGYIYAITDGIKYALKDGEAYVAKQSQAISGELVIADKILYKDQEYIITEVINEAFYDCSELTSITIPNSVTSIGSEAFYHCSSLTIYCEVSSKPDGWDNDWNYSNCPVVWDYNNNEIADDGYIYAIIDGIKYGLKDGEAYIAKLFRDMSGELVIADKISYQSKEYVVTSIGWSAFSYCRGLISVTIPNSVTSIGSKAFEGCNRLESITIPDSVTSIGWNAFYDCSNLTNVTFNNTQGWWCSDSSSATSGTSISSSDLKDPSTAATYLTDTYKSYYWKRS